MQRLRAVTISSVNSVDVINVIFLYVMKVSVTLEQKIEGATKRKMVLILKTVAGAGMDDVISIALHALLLILLKNLSINMAKKN